MPVQAPKRLFTVDEFHRMAEAGVFGEDDRLELLAGEVIEMTPIGIRHAACVDRLAHAFFERAGGKAIVRVQSPIVLDDRSEPQPDVSLLRFRPDFYRDRHPRPADVLLVVEVADTSVAFDRGTKVPLYARAGIAEAWVVDLAGAGVEVHRQPSPEGYREVRRLSPGDRLTLAAMPGLDRSVADLLA